MAAKALLQQTLICDLNEAPSVIFVGTPTFAKNLTPLYSNETQTSLPSPVWVKCHLTWMKLHFETLSFSLFPHTEVHFCELEIQCFS